MIKFHYHRARRSVPRLDIQPGDRLCHAYSDRSLEELLEWGDRHGLEPEWVDRRNALPHFDLHGEWLELAGEGVGREELVRDLRRWRQRRREGEAPEPGERRRPPAPQ